MRPTKLFLPFIFIFLTAFLFPDQKFRGGIFKTSEDFVNKKLTDYGQMTGMPFFQDKIVSLKFEKDGEKITYKLKTEKPWGFQDQEGENYRRFKGNYYLMLISGRGSMLVNPLCRTLRSDNGQLISLSNGYGSGIGLFFVKGLDGEDKLSMKDLLAEEPDLLEQYKGEQKGFKSENDVFIRDIKYLNLYNSRKGK